MIGASRHFFLALVCALAFARSGLSAQNETARGASEHPVDFVAITSAALPSLAGMGYGQVVVQATNNTDESRTVEVRLGAAASRHSTNAGGSARRVLAPRETALIPVIVPVFAHYYHSYTESLLLVDGRPASVSLGHVQLTTDKVLDDALSIAVFSDRNLGAGWPGLRAVELTGGTPAAVPSALQAPFQEPSPRWYGYPGAWRGKARLRPALQENWRDLSKWTSGNYFVQVAETRFMPDLPHAYTGCDAVVVDGGPVGTRELAELARWVRLGGCVVVARKSSFQSFGDLEDAMHPERALVEFQDARVARLGLGHVIHTEAEPLQGIGQRLALWWVLERGPSWLVPYQEVMPTNSGDVAGARRWHLGAADLPGVGEVSHRMLIGVMLVLALLMGPVNIILARRAKRPVALLLAIPALSIVGTLTVVVYGILHNGLSVVDGVRSWAVLDQGAQTVSSVTVRTLFMGSSGGRRLQPAAGTIVLPFEIEPLSFRTFASENYVVRRDLERGTVAFEAGYLPVRRVFAHAIYTDRATRKRIAVERVGETLRIENALGCAIEELWFRDREGDLWRTPRLVPAGETAELARALDAEELDAFLRTIAPGPYLSAYDGLDPLSYAARLGGQIAEDDCGISARRVNETQSLIGLLEREALR